MITHITKENRAKYVRLFAKAAEALKASNNTNYPEDFSISSLEEYFQHIEELYILDPQLIRLPLDEEMFDIDLNTRQITIPASFKKSGLGVQGDDLAEVVCFRSDRYFDATDLSQTFIMIQWEAPSGKKMVSPAYWKDVDSETDKLIFSWAITKEMTSMPGLLRFSVAFVDGQVVNSEGNELDIQGLEYRLGTLTSSININAGLSLAQQGKIQYENRLNDLKNRIKNTPILGGIIEGAAAFAELLSYNGFNWKSEKTFANIFEELVDDPTSPEEETGLTLLAISPNAGLIKYQWFKEGVEEPLASGPGAIRYLPVTKIKEELVAEGVYFIKEGVEDFRYFDERIDSLKVDIDGVEVINPLLHERVAFLPVEGPGTYYAKITNKEGQKVSTLDTSDAEDNGSIGVAIIPAPTEIDSVAIVSATDIFDAENPVEITSVVSFPEDETIYKNLKYQWYLNGEAIEGATEANHTVLEIGDYTLKVENHWNKAVSAEVVSENVIKVYLAAAIPEIVSFTADKLLTEGSEFAVVGANLTVIYKPINQTQATQYVRWFVSDSDLAEDAEDVWEPVLDEDGEFVEGAVYTPTKPGDYKAVVHNVITETNKQETETKVIRVLELG